MNNLAKLLATINKEKQEQQEEKNKNLNSFSSFIKNMDLTNKTLNENFGKIFEEDNKNEAFGKHFKDEEDK